ncbi:hypothetical protein GCM10020219_090560 [Nonomuraea dietziae]
MDVNAEHLRGSGSPLPTGFAAHLGMAPGGSLTASAPSGDVVISWHNQPTMGSMQERAGGVQRPPRATTCSSRCPDGGELLTRVPARGSPRCGPSHRALHLIGYTAPVDSEAEGLRLIGARVGLPETATREEVLTPPAGAR